MKERMVRLSEDATSRRRKDVVDCLFARAVIEKAALEEGRKGGTNIVTKVAGTCGRDRLKGEI